MTPAACIRYESSTKSGSERKSDRHIKSPIILCCSWFSRENQQQAAFSNAGCDQVIISKIDKNCKPQTGFRLKPQICIGEKAWKGNWASSSSKKKHWK